MISKESVMEVRNAEPPHRICFASSRSGEPKRNSGGQYVGKFSVPFSETIKYLFESDLNLDLYSSKYGDGVWRSIRTESEFKLIDDWVKRQGTRIFLRDCLDLSVALDTNFVDADSGQYTVLGDLESRGKRNADLSAVSSLVGHYVTAIRDMPGYRNAGYVAAVPPRPGKPFDLPTQIAAGVAAELGLTDLTTKFHFENTKQSIKELSLEEKWDAWEAAGLRMTQIVGRGRSVILIDDKYQSGVTIQFVASKLYEAGFDNVFGLYAVKTLRDTDNV